MDRVVYNVNKDNICHFKIKHVFHVIVPAKLVSVEWILNVVDAILGNIYIKVSVLTIVQKILLCMN